MPRLTSFDSHEAIPEGHGNEWSIREATRGSLFRLATFVAVRGGGSVPVGRQVPSSDRVMVRGVTGSFGSNAFEHFEISMPTSTGKLNFTLEPVDLGKYMTCPDVVSVILAEARIHISLKGLGTAVFRTSWRDSDIAKRIQGFVIVDAANEEDEESLVWLAATLGMHDLPKFISD